MSTSDRVTIDVDKRRAALKEIDDAKFGWQHVRACLVAGTGFFMDAYDLFAVNFASTMIGYVYYGGKTPANIDLGLKVSGSIGTLLGQLFFGYLADRLGRKKVNISCVFSLKNSNLLIIN
jgi:PHS family inorganic phosphate transporter-like MFS transporter